MKEHGLNHFRVLVADDDSSILDLFQHVLSRVETDQTVHLETGESESTLFQENASSQSLQCFDVVTCQQGDEAVDAVKSSIKENRPFSVAFIDIRMPPGRDGIWTAEHIRAFDSNIEIVILTGDSDTHPRDITRRVPPVHKLLYLQKPFHSWEIYQCASTLSMKWHTGCEFQRVSKGLEKSVEARIQAFKESESHFKNFLENLGDIAYEADSYGNVTYVNKTAEIITGVPLKDIIGKPFLPLFTEESQAIAMDVYQRTLKGESLQFDLTFTNGRICHYKNEPLKDKEGQVIGVFGIARDITDLKYAEEALRESEENFRTLAENANDGIVIAAGKGEFVFANKRAAELTGYSISELLKTTIKDLAHPDEFERIKKRYRAIISGKPCHIQYETKIIRKNGKEMPIEVASARSQWQGQPADVVLIRDQPFQGDNIVRLQWNII
jgi:PAS domain S-box-containing protein